MLVRVLDVLAVVQINVCHVRLGVLLRVQKGVCHVLRVLAALAVAEAHVLGGVLLAVLLHAEAVAVKHAAVVALLGALDVLLFVIVAV